MGIPGCGCNLTDRTAASCAIEVVAEFERHPDDPRGGLAELRRATLLAGAATMARNARGTAIGRVEPQATTLGL